MSPPISHAALPPTVSSSFGLRDGQDDLASVSTETEDDPVNMAMRATLGSSSVDEEESQDGEEIIVWNARSVRRQSHHISCSSLRPGVKATPLGHNSPARPGPSTAQDLLQNLMIDNNRTPSANHTPPLPRQSSYHTGQHSPGMLFGGDATGSSIWTMTREESGRGRDRNPPNVNIANIWQNDQTPSPPAISGLPGSGGAWHRPSGSGGTSGLGNVWASDTRVGGFGVGVGGQNGASSTGPWAETGPQHFAR
jgi:hypothetical protein